MSGLAPIPSFPAPVVQDAAGSSHPPAVRPWTVIQLLPALHGGGVERSTLEIAEALVRAGHRALVVSAGGRLVPQLEALGAEHIALDIGRKSPLSFRHVCRLRRLFAERGADIVHARSRLPAWLVLLAWRGLPAATRPRLVTTVHGLNSPSGYSAVMTRGECVICVSDTVRAYVLRHYPRIDPARLRTIPRGVDPAMFPAAPVPDPVARAWAAAQHPALAGDGPLLLLPGRGTRLKGHADALRLLAAIRSDGLDARLWLPGAREAGREAYVAELEAESMQAGLAAVVAFTPPTDAIARAYAASDVVLQLSRKPEAFGRTVIEALSCGRPVVGWAHGGVGELLAELDPQGAVPAFDAEALHVAVRERLARRAPLPATMAAALRRYDLATMRAATLACYAELLDAPRMV